MCLIKKKRGDMPRMAKKKIKVYKVLRRLLMSRKDSYWYRSPFLEYTYTPHSITVSKLSVSEESFYVHKGLHAYTSRKKALNEVRYVNWCFLGYNRFINQWEEAIVVEAWIPYGAYYLIGRDDEIVTDTLIVESFKPIKA